MQRSILSLIVLTGTMLLTTSWSGARQPAQQPPEKNDPNNPPGQVTFHVIGGPGGASGGAVSFGPGGGGNMFVMPGPGGPGMFGHDALAPVISVLGELNLAPDFSLSAEQKQKIQAIRDEFKQSTDMWRAQNDDTLKQLDEQQKELFQGIQAGTPPDPEQMQQLMEQRRQLMETAPNGEDQATQVKALLNAEQLKQFEARQAALAQERQAMMERMPMRMGGPGMGGPPREREKDKDGKGR